MSKDKQEEINNNDTVIVCSQGDELKPMTDEEHEIDNIQSNGDIDISSVTFTVESAQMAIAGVTADML